MKYYRLGDYYYAIDAEKKRTYMCKLSKQETTVQYCIGEAADDIANELNKNVVKKEISESKFQAKFSEAIDCLHTITPFA